jgi:DNA-binding MarR family transcriptional regulator
VKGKDVIDRCIPEWEREFPEMDIATEALIGRIHKISRYVQKSLNETAAEFGLTISDWDMLSALRRQGPPYRLSPTELAKELMLSSGAMTNRLDRLEDAGLVQRRPDPDDRRAVRVELTEKGRDMWGEAVGVQAAKEQMFAGELTAADKEQLNSLLRRMLLTLEEKAGPFPRRAGVELDEALEKVR